jgi:hypothetical protein
MRELGRGWSNFRTESKQYGIIVLLIREEGRDAYATTNMGQLRATHKMATNRTAEASSPGSNSHESKKEEVRVQEGCFSNQDTTIL